MEIPPQRDRHPSHTQATTCQWSSSCPHARETAYSALRSSASFSAIAKHAPAWPSSELQTGGCQTRSARDPRLTVCPEAMVGNALASHTRSPRTPCTRKLLSSAPSGAIRQVHAGWYTVSQRWRMTSSSSSSDSSCRRWSRSARAHSPSRASEIGGVWATRSRRRTPRRRMWTSRRSLR